MSKIKYSREQLLSLSGLDVCSKLPSGFDPSILSEFEDGYNSIPERPRIPGSLSSQNFRRGEYGSSPPTRGDLGNSSRGIHGKWDTRSSGLNDRDADLEPDSGRRYGNQSRRSWQNPEGDGLLGSGSFPKASGFSSASATNVRGSGQYQLNRTNEPYHPPRPYKATPHSRRDATDIINEETFGSSEGSSQDRAEEERKRRASFEQFRKEQKAFHEKQTQFPDKHNENVDPDKAAPLVDSEDDKKLWDKNLRLEDMAPSILQGDSAKCTVAAQTSASRPLVPPGFIGVALEKNLGAKSIITQPTSEVGIVKVDENITQLEGNVETSNNLVDENLVSNVNTNEQKYEIRTIHTPFTDINEKPVVLSSEGAIFGSSVRNVSPTITSSNLSEAYGGRKNDEGTEFYAEKVPGHDVKGIASNEHSTSILEKLFGKASIVDGVSVFSEPADVTANTEDHVPFRSSKFTHWFREEEKNVQDDLTSGKPEDLLSLIVSGEKDGSQVPRVTEKIPSIYPHGSNNLIQKSGTSTSSTITSIEPPYQSSNSGGTPGVLTCEDLEQSILSECGGNGSNSEHSVQVWNGIDTKAERRPEVNNHASQHLLFLLQKGTSANDLAQLPNQEVSENPLAYDSQTHNASIGDGEKVTTSEKNLTLETLFGTAFMKELQSVKAPVSIQRGSVGAVPPTDGLDSHGFPFSVSDDGFSPRSSTKSTLECDVHVSNHLQQSKSNKNEEAWVGYDGPQRIVGPNVIGSIDRPDEELEIQLPEEDSLITLSDPVISQHSMVVPVGNASKADSLSSSSIPVDIVDKLAELNAVLKRERSGIPAGLDGQRFLHGLSSPVEPDSYLNQQEQPTSQFAYLQMNQGRSSFHPLDPHPSRTNHPIKVMGPENIHPEFSQHHASNMIHPSPFQHAPNGPTRFSPPPPHPMLQHMHMQSNLPPPHLLRGLPRGAPMPPFAVNHMSGYAPEPNPMQNFPYGHQQANYGGLELPMQAHGGTPGNNHPEALERLFEMELRANLKKMHPVAGVAHSLGNNGHGIDMGFRYR